MYMKEKLGRLLVSSFFIGLALIQLQDPQYSIQQTHEKTVDFLKWIKQITQSQYIMDANFFTSEISALSVLGCSILKLFVGLCILMKWDKLAKLLGNSYLLMALFVLNNPFRQKFNEYILYIGVIGAFQFVGN